MGKKFIDKNYLVIVKEKDNDSINEDKNKKINVNEKNNEENKEENKEENEKGIKLELKKTKKYKHKKFCWFYHIFIINIKWHILNY